MVVGAMDTTQQGPGFKSRPGYDWIFSNTAGTQLQTPLTAFIDSESQIIADI